MNNKELASKILSYVGGKENIQDYTHCVTRLRFNLINDDKANAKEIEALDGVIGVQLKGGQFQVIIGNKVTKVYDELEEIVGATSKNNVPEKKEGSIVSRIFKALSSILIPSLPPIIGGGMIKGFLFMFWEFGWIEWGSDVFNLFNIVSDGMFYFYPFLLAVSAAEYFKTNKYMALAIAGSLMHPTMFEGINGGLSNLIQLGFLKVPYLDYSSSVLPIILAVWGMSYVYRFFEKRIPDIVSVIFTPMLTLVIVIPIALVAVAPLGFYIGEYIAIGINAIIDFNPILAGFVIGLLRPLTVFTGTHHAVRAIVSQQLSTYHYTTIGAMNYMSTMAQAAAPLAVYFILRKRNKKMGELSLSSAVSGFLGVTEPGLYGVIMKYKVAFVAVSIGGGIGAAISSYFGGAEYAMVMSSLVTIPATFGKGFIGIAIGLPVSIIVTMAIIFAFKGKLIEEDNEQRTDLEVSATPTKKNIFEDKTISVASPVDGEVIQLKDVPDKAFSSNKLGKGIAIKPTNSIVYSPVNGVITAVYPTKHAIGITTEHGTEILIHIGIDTVELKGEGFTQLKGQGEIVKVGDKLVEFDKEMIMEKGYNVDIIVVVLNTEDYLDVIPNTVTKVKAVEDEILNIII